MFRLQRVGRGHAGSGEIIASASSLDMFVNPAEASDVCPDVAGTSTVIMARVKIATQARSRFSGRSLGRVPASARGGSAWRSVAVCRGRCQGGG